MTRFRNAALWSLLAGLALAAPALADGGPSDAEVAKAISRGLEFLQANQTREGSWSEPRVGGHELGVTALAGLALLENEVDVDDPAVKRASRVVRELASDATVTYDLALAILFLAREHPESPGPNDALISGLAARLAYGQRPTGMWTYFVPPDVKSGSRRGADLSEIRSVPENLRDGDNSNTQFALLAIWAAGRHGFDPNTALERIERHFRKTQQENGRWLYALNWSDSTPAMNCAALMGLAISASRPDKAERQTSRARGAALAADPIFKAGLREVMKDARQLSRDSQIYYLWSLERVCVALGLRALDTFDWYAEGAKVLLSEQHRDGSWDQGTHGAIPETCLALLFLRKANLAFELERVLKLPSPTDDAPRPARAAAKAPQEPAATKGDGDVSVEVRGSEEKGFPTITLDFEVKHSDGSPLLDATKADFRVTEYGENVQIESFQSPRSKEIKPATVVLVVDHSGSMRKENRIGALKEAVATFLKVVPKGSRIAVVAFSSDVRVICPFTDDASLVQAAVDKLSPDGFTRYFDAVSAGLELIEKQSGRRAVLALTDGEDTASKQSLAGVITDARNKGLPVYTVGLGSSDEIESDDLQRLAEETRGQYFPAQRTAELASIFEAFAVRQGQLYQLSYTSNHKLQDGTLRDVRVFYRQSQKAGIAQVYVPGMVVPKSGWPALFLALVAGLLLLAALPIRRGGRVRVT
jgi:VWFA-related protein